MGIGLKLITGKKGIMPDFFDLIFMVLILFFALFFIQLVLNSEVEAKTEISLENLDQFNSEQQFLYYLNYPVLIGEREIKMKDLILLAVNTNQEELFEEKTEAYFREKKAEGSVAVYNTEEFRQEKASLFSFSNVVFGSGKKSSLELPNLENKQIPSLTVVFSREK